MRDLAMFYMITEHPVIVLVLTIVILGIVIFCNVFGTDDNNDKK